MKHDLKKELPAFFTAPRGRFEETVLTPASYFAVDGAGNPNTSPAYTLALEALYGAAYALKFLSKARGVDYTVPPLEGLWWADDPDDFVRRNKEAWRWTMLLMIPPFVDADLIEQAMDASVKKKPDTASRLDVRVLSEGAVLQTLHIGSYDDETPVVKDLHEVVMPAGGWEFNGHHHEIYLSDPRRTAAEKLKTILRQPVRKRS